MSVAEKSLKIDLKKKLPEEIVEKRGVKAGEKRGGYRKKEKITYEVVKKSLIGSKTDKVIVDFTNLFFLKDCPEKMKETDLGSAMWYAITWYYPQLPLDHPIMILGMAMFSYGSTVAELRKSKGEKKKEKPKVDEHGKTITTKGPESS